MSIFVYKNDHSVSKSEIFGAFVDNDDSDNPGWEDRQGDDRDREIERASLEIEDGILD